MSRDLTPTVHLWSPPSPARHRSANRHTLAEWLAGYALGRGSRLTRVQPERSGSRVLAQTRPGEMS
jgi:hypothetical protein